MTTGRPAQDGASRRPLQDRYELLFVLLLLTFVLSAFADQGTARLLTPLLYAAALLVALRSGRVPGGVARAVRVVLAVGTVAAGVSAIVSPSTVTQGVLACWVAAVVLTTIVVILRRIVQHEAVTFQTVFGALSAYLLIGFFFASVYTALARLGPQPFFAGGQPAANSTVQYFSFVTLTTTGYGDYTALSEGGRSLAVMEALLGQIFLVTLVARLVAMFGTVRPGAPRRAEDRSALDDRTRTTRM